MRIDRLKIFLDSLGGGAWPFRVGGVICLVNSVNERDLDLFIVVRVSGCGWLLADYTSLISFINLTS